MSETVQSIVKDFILREFLPGEDANELQGDTPLITGGILDSIGTLKLVAFLEEQFGISIAAHEASIDYLNSLQDIGTLVVSKQKA